MPNLGVPARDSGYQMTHYFRLPVVYSDTGRVLTIGVLPARSIVINAGVLVATAFNHGTNNLLDIGTSADDDGLGTNLSLATIGLIVWDELATSNDLYSTSDVTLIATPDFTGTAGTAGSGFVYVEYIPPAND